MYLPLYANLILGLGNFRDCENNRDVVFIIVMLMSTFHNRDCVIPLRFVCISLFKSVPITLVMSAVTLNFHQNSAVTCIAKNVIHNSLFVCNKCLQCMTIVIVLTIVICHDSRIVMSQNVTIAHLYLILMLSFAYTYEVITSYLYVYYSIQCHWPTYYSMAYMQFSNCI